MGLLARWKYHLISFEGMVAKLESHNFLGLKAIKFDNVLLMASQTIVGQHMAVGALSVNTNIILCWSIVRTHLETSDTPWSMVASLGVQNCDLVVSTFNHFVHISFSNIFFSSFAFVPIACSSLLQTLFSSSADSTRRKVWYPVNGDIFCTLPIALYLLTWWLWMVWSFVLKKII